MTDHQKIRDALRDAFDEANTMEHCAEAQIVQAHLAAARRTLEDYVDGARGEPGAHGFTVTHTRAVNRARGRYTRTPSIQERPF